MLETPKLPDPSLASVMCPFHIAGTQNCSLTDDITTGSYITYDVNISADKCNMVTYN